MARLKVRLGRISHSNLIPGIPLLNPSGWLHHYLELDERAVKSMWHCLGAPGKGKTKLLESVWHQLFAQRQAVSYVDPRGGAFWNILRTLKHQRYFDRPDAFEKLIVINFSAHPHYLKMNILDNRWIHQDELIRVIIEALKRAFPELHEDVAQTGTSVFDQLIDAGLRVLYANRLPIYYLYELLSNPSSRSEWLKAPVDEVVRSFWTQHWNRLRLDQQYEIGGSAIRRAYWFAVTERLKYCLGQKENILQFRTLMDQGVSFLINLGGIVSEKDKQLLAGLLMHGFEVGTLSRRPNSKILPPHFLIVDEFAEMVRHSPQSLMTLLDMARQHGLFIYAAHQSFSQAVNPRLVGALQNTHTRITFGAGHLDAKIQAGSIGHYVSRSEGYTPSPIEQEQDWQQRIMDLPDQHALVKVGTNKALEIDTLPVPEFNEDLRDVMGEYYRRYYSHKDKIQLTTTLVAPPTVGLEDDQ
jgi:hypothetical protein